MTGAAQATVLLNFVASLDRVGANKLSICWGARAIRFLSMNFRLQGLFAEDWSYSIGYRSYRELTLIMRLGDSGAGYGDA